jgi:hypothetical protein
MRTRRYSTASLSDGTGDQMGRGGGSNALVPRGRRHPDATLLTSVIPSVFTKQPLHEKWHQEGLKLGKITSFVDILRIEVFLLSPIFRRTVRRESTDISNECKI